MPTCGTVAARQGRLNDAQRAIDQFAKTFLDQDSRAIGHEGEKVREASENVEHATAVIRKADGTLRFGVQTSGAAGEVDFDLTKGVNEQIVAIVHTHPFNGLHFSRGDLATFGREGRNNRNLVGSYITYETQGGGREFKILERGARNGRVTLVP
jgi:hypothetical protein